MWIRIVHLEGARRGRTDASNEREVRIGTQAGAEVPVGAEAGIRPVHARIAVRGAEATLLADGPVRLNGRPVEEVLLRDGDVVELGERTRLRVRLAAEEADLVRSLHDDLARASTAGTPRRLRTSRIVAAASLLFFLALAGAGWLQARDRAPAEGVDPVVVQESARREAALKKQRAFYDRRLAGVHSELRDLERRMASREEEVAERVGEVRRAVADVQSSVLKQVSHEVARSIGSNPDLLAARNAVERITLDGEAAERIIAQNSGSVCLIQGAYGFGRVKDGEWRFLREAAGDLLPKDVADDKVPLMLEGDGPVFKVEYTGTGFLVDEGGIVITNRHIAQPWWHNDAAEPLLQDGFEPRFLFLRAYFPDRSEPVVFDLDRTVHAAEADLAALRFQPGADMPPALRIADEDEIAVGRRVILLGFPSGINALLARSDEAFAESLTEEGDFDPARILDALAGKGLVRVLPTQGHIGDVVGDKVLFDAPTAGGGSGAPLCDLEGRVVAVNYGILKAFSGANFGVPARHARSLLERARQE